MDASILIGVLGGIVVAIVGYLAFTFTTRETSFEDAYGAQARKLLSDRNNKQKAKGGKPKKNPKVEDGQRRDSERDEHNGISSTPPHAIPGFDSSVETGAVIEVKDDSKSPSPAKKNRKKNKKSISPKPEKEVVEELTSKLLVTDQEVVLVETLAHEEVTVYKDELHETVPKDFVNETVQKKNVSPQQSKPTKTTPKQKPNTPKVRRSASPIGQVNMEKLIQYLTSSDAEPEYLSFAVQLQQDLKQKEKVEQERRTENAKKISSKDLEVRRLQEQLEELQCTLAKSRSVEQALKDANEKHIAFENTATPKLAEHRQLSEAVRSLNAQLADQKSKTAALTQLQADNDTLKNDVSLLSDLLSNTNARLAKVECERDEAKKEIKRIADSSTSHSDYNALKAQFNQSMENVRVLKENLTELDVELDRRGNLINRLTEESQNSSKKFVEVRDRADAELKELHTEISTWQNNYKLLEDRLAQAKVSEETTRKVVEELKVTKEELSRIQSNEKETSETMSLLEKELEILRADQETKRQQIEALLSKSSAEMAAKSHYEEQIQAFEKMKDKFMSEVHALNKQCEGLSAERSALHNQKQELLKKVSELEGSSRTSAEDDEAVRRLEKALADEKSRNQELRDRNLAVTQSARRAEENVKAAIQKAEGKAYAELHSVIATVASVLKVKPLSDGCGIVELEKWVDQAVKARIHEESVSVAAPQVVVEKVEIAVEESAQYKELELKYEQMELAQKLYTEERGKNRQHAQEICKKLSRAPLQAHGSQSSEEWEVLE